jgi:hypothetical protein
LDRHPSRRPSSDQKTRRPCLGHKTGLADFTRELSMRTCACWFGLAAVLLASCSGCGSDAGQFVGKTIPVKGKVTFKGKPLTQGEIVFEPDGGAGREAHGNIQGDGTFELTTFKAGDGAVPGTHRVAVSGTSKKDAVPVKYKNTSSSKTEVEVAEGKADYLVDLK